MAQRVAAAQAPSQRRQARRARNLAVCSQHPRQRLTVPVLLVAPQHQEHGDLGVGVRTGVQQVAEVTRRVELYIVCIPDASEDRLLQRQVPESVEVDVLDA